MSNPQNTFLTQKRHRLSSSVTDSFQLLSTEEFIDINETKISPIPFISFTDFNFDFQPSSKIIVPKKRPQTPKPSQQLITNENAMITALLEDGMFEEKLNFPMALYAEMLWDSNQEIDDILCNTSLRPDVDFV